MKKFHAVLMSALIFSGALAFVAVPEGAGGVTLTAVPVTVRLNTAVEPISLGVADDGRIYMTWSEKSGNDINIMMSYSSNNGSAFSPAVRVNSQAAGSQQNAQLATANNSLYIVWDDGAKDGGDIVLARSDDGGLTFEETRVSSQESGTQTNPGIAANGDRVAIAWQEYRSDNTVRIWNGVNGDYVGGMTGHQGAVRDAEFSPNGAYIATASEDSTVKIWNAATLALVRNITVHTDKVMSVNWSADGKMLATGSFDHSVTIFNTTDFSVIAMLNSTGGTPTMNFVNAVAFSPDSGRIAAACNGQYGSGTPSGFPTEQFNLTVWNLAANTSWTRNEQTPDPNRGFSSSVTDAAFSHNGTYLASGGKDGYSLESGSPEYGYTLKIWNSADGTLFRNVMLTQPVHAVSWSPDDRFVAAGLGNGSVAMVNVSDTADIIWMANTHTGGVNSVDWSVVRNEIVSGASDPVARLWDSVTRTEREKLSGHMNSVYSADWSSDGLKIVTAGGASSVYGMGEIQIFCAVSDDGGRTFSSPVLVSDSCSKTRNRPRMALDDAGTVSTVWYDYRSGSPAIYFANSTDMGASFSANVGIDTVSTDCAIPEIFADAAGTAHVAWQYGLGAGIRYSNSTDGFSASRIMALNAQEPRITGSRDGSSVWVSWRYQNATTKLNHTAATISYNGGASFTENITVNTSGSFIGGHAYDVDRYNQTYAAWEISGTIYFRTTVLADAWPPTVLSTSPEDWEADVSIFTGFTVRFSEPMERDVTEAAFSWTDGTDTWGVGDCEGNTGVWNAYRDTVTFTPKNPLQYQKIGYSFRIASDAEDLAGNRMGANMTFHFTTGADADPPTITYSPSQATVSYNENYTVMALIEDQWGTVASARLFYQGVNGASPTASLEMVSVGSGTYQAVIPPQQSLGNVYYYLEATDGYGNKAWSPANYTNHTQLYNVSVIDGVRPTIQHVPLVEADVFRDISIWATVADEISLQSVSLNYREISSQTYIQVPMAYNGTSGTYSYTVPAQTSVGQIHYNITARDSSDNFNSTPIYSVQMLDRTVPLINSVIPELLANNTKVLVRANVTDDVEVGSVTLYFKAVGGDAWVSRPMTHVSGDIYEFTIPPQRRSGQIYYYVNATDSSGNTASTLAEQDQFLIEVVGVGTDYTLYYVLGAVLVILMLVLVYLLVRKMSRPDEAPAEVFPEEEELPPSDETTPEKADESP